MRQRKDAPPPCIAGSDDAGNMTTDWSFHGMEERAVTDIHDKPPGMVTPLAIAAGAVVLIPSLTALALALFAVGAAVF